MLAYLHASSSRSPGSACSRRIALAALPALALNLLSAAPTQTSIHFHYTAGLIPPLIAAAVLGASGSTRAFRASRWSCSAWPRNYLLGAIPVWSDFPGGETRRRARRW